MWLTPAGYEFLDIPMITLEQMYELIDGREYYNQLPDSLKKLQPFVMDASHIKSVIESAYTTSLIDGRSQRNDHYNIGDDNSDESTDFLEGDMVPAYSDVVQEPIQMKYRHDQWFDRVVLDHLQMKEVLQYLDVLLPFDMVFRNTIASNHKVKCFCPLHTRFGPLHVTCNRLNNPDYFNMTCSMGKNGTFKDGEALMDHCRSVGDWKHRLVHNYLVEMYPTSVAQRG